MVKLIQKIKDSKEVKLTPSRNRYYTVGKASKFAKLGTKVVINPQDNKLLRLSFSPRWKIVASLLAKVYK